MLTLPDAYGHGYMQDPPARNFFCGVETQPHQIQFGGAKTPACSTAFKINPTAAYDYMAVLSHTQGRAKADPLPAHVCGYASEMWKGVKTPWDAAMDWPTNAMAPGPRTITWNIASGAHFADTEDFKYWITKADFVFDPSKELAWSDFESEPFCSLIYDDGNPTSNPNIRTDKAKSLFMTDCTVPARQGRHVIYGEWGRNKDTYERFHGCIDAAFAGTSLRMTLPRSQKGMSLSPMSRPAVLPRSMAPWAAPFDALGKTLPRGE